MVSQAGSISEDWGLAKDTEEQLLLQGRPMAMTFRKAGFMDWRPGSTECREFNSG